MPSPSNAFISKQAGRPKSSEIKRWKAFKCFDVSEDFAEDGSKGDGNVCEFLSILFLRISSAFIQKSLMSCMMSLACMSLGFIIGKYNSIQ